MALPPERWLFNIVALAVALPGLWGALVGTYTLKARYGRSTLIDLDEAPLQGAFYIGVSWTFACVMVLANNGMAVWIDRLAGPLAEVLPAKYLYLGSLANITMINMCVVLLIRKIFRSYFTAKDGVDLPPEVVEEWEEECHEQELEESRPRHAVDESRSKQELSKSGSEQELDETDGEPKTLNLNEDVELKRRHRT